MKYSVIIPVYNVEKYLRECVLSINPTNRDDIEIIMVNDGSKDNSAKICQELKKELKNVKVINKENSGQMDSWIKGFQMATGEYTYFVDSDDKLSENFFDVIDQYTKKNYDIIAFDYYKYYKDSVKEVRVNHIPYGELSQETLKEMKNHIGDLLTEYSLYRWDKVIKTEIIKKSLEKIDFRSVYFEDHPISILNLLNSNSIYYLNQNLYYYRIRKSSITHKKNARVFSDIDIIENSVLKIAKELNSTKKEIRKINLYFLYQYSRWALKSEEFPKNKKVKWKDIKDIKGKNLKIVLLLYKLRLKKVYQFILDKKNKNEEANSRETFE